MKKNVYYIFISLLLTNYINTQQFDCDWIVGEYSIRPFLHIPGNIATEANIMSYFYRITSRLFYQAHHQ